MVRSVSLSDLYLFLSIFLLFTFQTFGFDLYHHVISISSFSSIAELNYDNLLFDYRIPRYLFFHYLSFIPLQIGIPFVVEMILVYFFIMRDLKKFVSNFGFLRYYLTIFLLVLLTLFWAPISLSILLLISFSISKRNVYLFFASLLHPVGLILSIFVILMLRKIRLLLLVAFAYVGLLLFVKFYVSDFKCESVAFAIQDLNVAGTDYILDKLFSKWREILAFSLIFLFVLFTSKSGYLSSLRRLSFPFVFSALTFFSSLFSLHKQLYDRSPGIYSLVLYEYDFRIAKIVKEGWFGIGIDEIETCDMQSFRLNITDY